MKCIELPDGDLMPMVGLGTWQAEPGQVYEAVREAIGLGYRHIDSSPVYGNEREIGKALAESFEQKVVTREEMWITSKLWNDSHRPEDVRLALERTLTDLRLDFVDLYLMHWPAAFRKGVVLPSSNEDFVPIEEIPILKTWEAMEELVDTELCHHLGVSNFTVAKLTNLLGTARFKPEMNQIELHPYLQQTRMLDFCAKHAIGLTAFSPLGSASRPSELIGKHDPVLLEDPTIAAIAKRHNATTAQVVLGWALHRGTAIIPKTVRRERLQQNLVSAELTLSSEELHAIARLDRNRRYATGDFLTIPGSPYTMAYLWQD